MANLIHHHYIYQANVSRNIFDHQKTEKSLETFLYDLVKEIKMKILIYPIVKYNKKNDAWTGFVGIITSHIAFHYWVKEHYIQMDIYSCKKFNIKKAKVFLDSFWQSSNIKSLFINREVGKKFVIKEIN